MSSTDHLAFLGKEPASVTMGIHQQPLSVPGEITYTQQVQPWQKTRDGHMSLPAYCALIDTAAGSAAYQFSGYSSTEWVVSRLSVTCAPWAPVSEVVSATSRCEHVDTVTGTASARAEVFSGEHFLASVSCRSVSADRIRVNEEDLVPEMKPGPDGGHATAWTGPFADHLGVSAPSSTAGSIEQLWNPQEWQSNGLGTVQGGLVLGVVATSAEAAGTLLVGDGFRVAISDLNLDILRSPQVSEGAEYRIVSTVVRQGRRLVVLSTEIVDGGGRVFARGAVTLLPRTIEGER
ncbi:PaaI family thioesterase [Dietzia maris]|uniref:PaaI family thioesterase n=1 Tax=Dietzia maris TaxID=37915 RepID=UPI0037C5B7C7